MFLGIGESHEERNSVVWANGAAAIILIGLVVLIWFPPLFRSFWLDEAGTFWMAHEGTRAAIAKSSTWAGQSIFYALITSVFCLESGPFREFVLRVPTLIGITVACFFLYRMAERAIGPGTGVIAVIFFLFIPSVYTLGTQARAYGLGMAAVMASSWFLFSWAQHTRARTTLCAYVIASALVIYFQYIFALVFIAHVLYLVYVFSVERQTERWLDWVGASFALGVLISPLLPNILLLTRERHKMQVAPMPRFSDFDAELIAPALAVALVITGIAVYWFFPALAETAERSRTVNRPLLILITSWWLIPPAIVFVLARTTATNVFIPRYLLSTAPARALVLAYVGHLLFRRAHITFWALTGVLMSTAGPPAILASIRPGEKELLPMVRAVRDQSRLSVPPLLITSDYVEADYYNWRAGLAPDSHLYAPLVAYPVSNPVLPLPYSRKKETDNYVVSLIRTRLSNEDTVLFVTSDPNWLPFMIDNMRVAGFESSVQSPNIYYIVTFRNERNRR